MYVMMFMKMFVAVKTLDTAGGGAGRGRGGGGAVIRGGQLRWANEASWSAAHSSSQVTGAAVLLTVHMSQYNM